MMNLESQMNPRPMIWVMVSMVCMHLNHLHAAQGVIDVQVPAGLSMRGCHLTVGNNTLPEVFPEVPNGTEISFWSRNQQEITEKTTYSDASGWSNKEVSIVPGTGFWINAPRTFRWVIDGSYDENNKSTSLWARQNMVTVIRPSGTDFVEKTGIQPRQGNTIFFGRGVDINLMNSFSFHPFCPNGCHPFLPLKLELDL